MYPFDPDPHIPVVHPAGAGGPHDHCSSRPSAGGPQGAISSLLQGGHVAPVFLWLMSPLPNSFIVLSFKEPVIKLTTLSFQSNQTLLLDLIVFQLFIGVPVGRLKC